MAETLPAPLNCPMCGAPVKGADAPNCAHCGARLATVACPTCFAMVLLGTKFCSHCGSHLIEPKPLAETNEKCPRCSVNLHAFELSRTRLQECSRCLGIWVKADEFESISVSREKQGEILGGASTAQPLPLEKKIHYLPCPICRKLMNRVNFARCSNVIVDVCKPHGTWFDRDELRQIVLFLRSGGMQKSRAIEVAELEERRRRLQASGTPSFSPTPTTGNENWADGLFTANSLIRLLGK